MATKTNRFTKKETKKEKPSYEYELQVKRVLDGKYGTLFNLEINHVIIYGCKVCEDRNGVAFIGFPKRKGKNDTYWNVAYAPLTEDQTAEVLQQVSDILDAQEEEE